MNGVEERERAPSKGARDGMGGWRCSDTQWSLTDRAIEHHHHVRTPLLPLYEPSDLHYIAILYIASSPPLSSCNAESWSRIHHTLELHRLGSSHIVRNTNYHYTGLSSLASLQSPSSHVSPVQLLVQDPLYSTDIACKRERESSKKTWTDKWAVSQAIHSHCSLEWCRLVSAMHRQRRQSCSES